MKKVICIVPSTHLQRVRRDFNFLTGYVELLKKELDKYGVPHTWEYVDGLTMFTIEGSENERLFNHYAILLGDRYHRDNNPPRNMLTVSRDSGHGDESYPTRLKDEY